MYQTKSLDTEVLLRWSKLLEYDFFRIYSQHLILYAPPSAGKEKGNKKSNLPRFRKNIYTKEVIDFILDMIKTGEKTKIQVMEEYNILKQHYTNGSANTNNHAQLQKDLFRYS